MSHQPSLRRHLSRRHVLQIGGAALAASPFVPVLEAQSQVGTAKRFVILGTHNGTVLNEFFPDTTGRDFELKRILTPLEAYKDRMNIVGGTAMYPHPGGAHRSFGKILTNKKSDNQDDREAKGPSVDQVVADRISGNTPIRSLHLGLRTQGNSGIFWRGSEDRMVSEDDPRRSFNSVFGMGNDEEAEAIRRQRQSVLDRVNADLTRLKASVGLQDQQVLDRHVTSVRELERSLQVGTISCDAAPDDVDGLNPGNDAHMPRVARLQNQVMRAALACDVTRVGTLQYGRVVGKETYPWMDIRELHHTISHENSRQAVEQMTLINTWYMEQLADLLDQLSATPEGGGSMLDNTLVLYANPLSAHASHGKENMPFMTISGNWYFKGSSYTRHEDESIGKYLVNLCHAMGLDDIETFGDQDTSDGPLPDLRI